MILLVEKKAATRKKLCDMLSRERIIGVGGKQQVLEALVQHRTKLNAIVANAAVLSSILAEDTVLNLCLKISIPVPPIVVLYQPEQETIIKKISDSKYHFEFVEFDEKDPDFPDKYVKAVRNVHPEISVDMKKVKEVWAESNEDKEPQDLVDIREWLNDSGFADTSGQKEAMPKKDKKQKAEALDTTDYKKMYFELKKQHDQLLADFEELKKILE